MVKAATLPPIRIFAGKVKRSFIGTNTFRFTYAISGEEAAFTMKSTSGEALEVFRIEFTAKRAGSWIEEINSSASHPVGEFPAEGGKQFQFVPLVLNCSQGRVRVGQYVPPSRYWLSRYEQ